MNYAIVITPEKKEISLKMLESFNEHDYNLFLTLSPITTIENFPVYVIPILNTKGKQNTEKFFLCTEDDILEIESVAIIPVSNEFEAQNFIGKLKSIIVWQR